VSEGWRARLEAVDFGIEGGTPVGRDIRAALAEIERLEKAFQADEPCPAAIKLLARAIALEAAADREGTKRYADKWRAAEAEIERLTRERDEARSRASSLETQWAESDTAKAIFQAMERAEQAEAEVERLRAAGLSCMEMAGIADHMNILDVMGAALRGEGEKS
jgi:predicted  nucleic acid-binding Zn-ribbon protein